MSYYLMHRGWMDHHLFKDQPYSEREAWEYLIANANYAPTKYRQAGKIYDIPRGAKATSYRDLAGHWKWSVGKVIRFLKLLNTDGMISLKTEHNFVEIYLVNYEAYQNPNFTNGTETEQERNTLGTATDTKVKKVKEGKRKTNKEKISLESLSVDHNAEWLAQKRAEGRYQMHDEHFVLEQFKQYCLSKGKKYDNYLAAYRNAFEWEKFNPKQGAATKDDRARSAVLRGLGA